MTLLAEATIAVFEDRLRRIFGASLVLLLIERRKSLLTVYGAGLLSVRPKYSFVRLYESSAAFDSVLSCVCRAPGSFNPAKAPNG